MLKLISIEKDHGKFLNVLVYSRIHEFMNS